MGAELDGAIGWHDPAPIQEFAFQQAADQGSAADLEQNVLGSQAEAGLIFTIGEDLFHFLQSCGRNHKAELAAGAIFGMPGPASQTEAVHGDGRDAVLLHLKLDAGVDGTALIFGHGENGTGNQFLQLILGNGNAAADADIRQLRIIVGILCGNGKGSVAGTDGNLVALVHHHGDGTLGEPADNVAKKSGRQDALTGIGHICVYDIGNTGFHIVAGKAQLLAGLAEDTLQDRQTAFRGYCPSGNIQTLNQQTFFTGKTHSRLPFLFINKNIYISR